jgi:dienelactone hydrolase
VAWSAGATVAVLAALGLLSYRARASRAAELRWVRDSAVPAIRSYVDSGQMDSAFLQVLRARTRTAAIDTALAATWPRFTAPQTIRTTPDSASVAWAMSADSNPVWWPVGVTPLDSVRLPRFARLRLEKPGYRPLEIAVASYRARSEPFVLASADGPEDPMIDIPAETTQIYLPGLDHLPPLPLPPFRIGRAEVTNREFKQFVDSGGYRRPELWDTIIVLGGKPVAWAAAMSRFTDRTGRPGPATWEAGDFPSGQADYPAAGVSWYEAGAYARFAGKALPTVYHWSSAATTPLAFEIVPHSNFSGKGTAPAGRYPALGLYGLRDMAGNVREWCVNATGGSRYVLGGGWSDPDYSFTDAYAQEPGDRSYINGIRLVEYAPGDSTLATASRPVERLFRDFVRERPVPDAVFGIYRRQFEYDRRPLRAVVEATDSSAEDWIREKVVVDAAYGGERLPLYLFLPRGRTPPYQTIVYFPGSNALHTRVAEGGLESRAFDFILKSGRAVIYPVYKSTYERGDSTASDYSDLTNRYREHVVMWGKDLRRAIDYVESRSDLAGDKVGYFGFSWGGALGGIWPAIDPRLKVSVLLVAGLEFTPAQPEVDVINYLPRVRIPVLMLNGQYDFFFPVQTSQIPMFRLLGTPAEHKRQVISPGGHFVPRTQLISETLSWLDRYLGPVQ